MAVIELVLTVSAEELMLVVPLLNSVPVPSEVVPLKNWTVPVGVPDPGLLAVTVAFSVTAHPRPRVGYHRDRRGRVGFRDGHGDGRRSARREGGIARIDRRERRSAARRLIVVRTAVPVLSNGAVPSEVVPLKNWTLPVGRARGGCGGNGRGERHRLASDGRRRTRGTRVVIVAWSTVAVTAGEGAA